MIRLRWILIFIVFLGFPVSTTSAHDYWIMPETFHPGRDSILTAAFTASHNYFVSEEVPDITKFRVLVVTPQGQEMPLAFSRVESQAAWFQVPISGEGTYTISAVTTVPDYYSKTTDGWKPGRKSELENVVSSGKYIKSIKTLITVGTASDSYKNALGHAIEMVPQENPSVLKVGQELPVLVMYQGKPAKDVPVFGIYQGYKPKDHSDQPVKTKTNANGIARIKVDRSGPWVVFAKYEFDTPGNPHTDYENYRPYMMFEVK
jgi:uncharacterized GH25 family protein